MASISNRQWTYGMAAFSVMLVVALLLGLVVAPLLDTPHKVGWLVVAFLGMALLILVFTLLRLHLADRREEQALKTLPPGQRHQ